MPAKTPGLFEVLVTDKRSYGRRGRLHLKNGVIETPIFMPVGTHGCVRGLSSFDLASTRAELMLANTYHLIVRPGVDLIEEIGGLHSFSSWKKPILTDSGGFQVFSLAESRKMTEEGVVFRNSINGDLIHLNPEKVINAQERFGSDIMMVLDECPPATANPGDILAAVERTTRWTRRAQEARTRNDLLLFPIVQGGSHADIRSKSLKDILELERGRSDWEGFAIGGMSVGETKSKFVETLYDFRGKLPPDRPHYLMGVGTPRDLVFAVACGIDMFDCVLPSRNGRHGIVMTKKGRMNLFNSQYTKDPRPIDEECDCLTCQNYSRAFLRHIFTIEDALAGRLATIHNVAYFVGLLTDIKRHLEEGDFVEFAKDFLSQDSQIFLGSERGYSKYPEAFV